jgi:outer membrane receptor protein involved in Fe transport
MKISSRTALLCTLLIGFSLATRHLAAQSTSEATIVLPDADSAEPKTAEAAETSVDADSGEEVYILSDFEVSVEKDRGYHSAHSLAATRTNALIKDTPVNITVINKQLLEDLSIVNPNDLEKVVASAYKEDHGNNNRIRFRGFRTSFQLYEFMPRHTGLNWYNIERADVIRGSNSLIFGQSAPGGKVNYNAKRASFGRDRSQFTFRFGSEDLRSLNYDLNKIVNDEIAVRVMGAEDSKQSFKRYAESELSSQTIAVTYRPSRKTELRLHSEFNQSSSVWVPGTYTDNTTQSGASGIPYGLPATPEVVDYLPSGLLQSIYDYSDLNYNGTWANNNRHIDINSAQDILDLYAGITPENGGSLAYSDASNQSRSQFHLFDVTHQLNDHLNFKFSAMHERSDALSYRPEGGTSLSAAVPYGPKARNQQFKGLSGDDESPHGLLYVAPYWVETGTSDRSVSLRNTVSWEFEDGLIPNSKNQVLLGLDYDRRDSKRKTRRLNYAADAEDFDYLYDANGNVILNDPTKLNDQGNYYQLYGQYTYKNPTLTGVDLTAYANRAYITDEGGRHNWGSRGAVYYPIDYVGLHPISLSPSNSFTQDSEGNPLPIADLRAGEELTWVDTSYRPASTESKAAWVAHQGKFLNNRLNTLLGMRYDEIRVSSVSNQYQTRPSGATKDDPRYVIRSRDNTYKQFSPSLGGLYWLTPNIGLFANYAESIETPTGWELQPDGTDTPPQTGSGTEVGFKFEFMDGKLNGQIVAFDIEKVNDSSKYSREICAFWAAEQPNKDELIRSEVFEDPSGNLVEQLSLISSGRYIAETTVESQGAEVDIYYNPTDSLSLMLGYAYMDAEIQNSPVLADMDRGIIDGDPYPGFAHHNGVFTARYNFKSGRLKGWYVGVNQRYRSKTFLGTFFEDVGTTNYLDYTQNSVDFVDGEPDVVDVYEWADGDYRWNALINTAGTEWYDASLPEGATMAAPNQELANAAQSWGSVLNLPAFDWYDSSLPVGPIRAPSRAVYEAAEGLGAVVQGSEDLTAGMWGDHPDNGGNGDGILQYEERTIIDGEGNRVTAKGEVVKARRHRVWLSDHFSNTVFFGWGGQLPGMKGRGAPRFNVHVAVDNLFDAVDLIAKGNGQGGFTSPRSWSIRASVNF